MGCKDNVALTAETFQGNEQTEIQNFGVPQAGRGGQWQAALLLKKPMASAAGRDLWKKDDPSLGQDATAD
jgi:hypothetical protein